MGKDGEKLISRMFGIFIKRQVLIFFAGFAFALLCFVAINAAMEPVSKSEYCGTNCHEMDTAYQSWKASAHGTNEKGLHAKCIDCHAPSKDDYFTHLVFKAYAGGKDVYKHHFGGEYNVEEERENVISRLPNERCLGCHVGLLSDPSAEETRDFHLEAIQPEEGTEQAKCIDCHEEAGHLR